MKIMTRSSDVRHAAKQWDSATALLTTNPVPAGREAVWAQTLTFLDVGQRDGAHLVASVLVIDDAGLVLLESSSRRRESRRTSTRLPSMSFSRPTGADPSSSQCSISTCVSPRSSPRPPRLSSPTMS